MKIHGGLRKSGAKRWPLFGEKLSRSLLVFIVHNPRISGNFQALRNRAKSRNILPGCVTFQSDLLYSKEFKEWILMDDGSSCV